MFPKDLGLFHAARVTYTCVYFVCSFFFQRQQHSSSLVLPWFLPGKQSGKASNTRVNVTISTLWQFQLTGVRLLFPRKRHSSSTKKLHKEAVFSTTRKLHKEAPRGSSIHWCEAPQEATQKSSAHWCEAPQRSSTQKSEAPHRR